MVAGLAFILHQPNIQMVAVFLTAFCWSGIVWLFFFFRKEWGLKDWQALIVGLVVICSGWINTLGMEAYLFEFLLVLCLSLFLGKRYFLTGFFTGLLFLTRGEGILILGVISIIGIIFQVRKRKLVDAPFLKKKSADVVRFYITSVVLVILCHHHF